MKSRLLGNSPSFTRLVSWNAEIHPDPFPMDGLEFHSLPVCQWLGKWWWTIKFRAIIYFSDKATWTSEHITELSLTNVASSHFITIFITIFITFLTFGCIHGEDVPGEPLLVAWVTLHHQDTRPSSTENFSDEKNMVKFQPDPSFTGIIYIIIYYMIMWYRKLIYH